jgi:PII-like signaling protein
VVAKAEHIDGKENPRFVVTSLSEAGWAGKALYDGGSGCARRSWRKHKYRRFGLSLNSEVEP